MTRLPTWVVVFLLIVTAAHAQQGQPNQPLATMTIEGQDGPPYPIANVFVYGGTSATLEITGGANVHFLVAQAPSLTSNSFPFLGGVVDLDVITNPGAVVILMDGFGSNPSEFKTDGLGQYRRDINIPPNIGLNVQVAFQAFMEEPASPYFLELTAATSILTFPGITPIVYNLGDDNCIFANTQAQFGINIPFYNTTYNGCWMCANGYITFGSSSTDFTPTLAKMASQQPRISPFWSDLDGSQAASGDATLHVDQIDPNNPVLTFKWEHYSDWPTGVNGGLGYHTFGARIDVTSGDVEIHEFPNNQNSNYDILIGMSRGNNQGPAGTGPMDLSATFSLGPYVGLPNEGFYEGFAGNTSVTGAFPPSQVFDLAGNYWRHNAVGGPNGVGTTGTYYIMAFFIPFDPENP